MTYRDHDATLRARIADLERENAALRSPRTRWRIGWGEHSGVAVPLLVAACFLWAVRPSFVPPVSGVLFVAWMLVLAFVQREHPAPPRKPAPPVAPTPPAPSVFVDLTAPVPVYAPPALPAQIVVVPMSPWVPLGLAMVLTVGAVAMAASTRKKRS